MLKNKHMNTINDFQAQFKIHNKIDGYFSSFEMLQDIVYPFNLNNVKNKTIAEVGVGSGRILKALLELNPRKIYAIEPSKAIEISKNNIKNDKKIIKFIQTTAQKMKLNNEIDYIFSIGVIHHIPKPEIALKKIHSALKNKGEFIVWLYGKENNEFYLLIFKTIRKVTRLLPDRVLDKICGFFKLHINFLYYVM